MSADELAATGIQPVQPEARLERNDELVVASEENLRPLVAGPDEAVLDPTLIAERRRKRVHARAYRCAQVSLLLAYLLAITSLVALIVEEPDIGKITGSVGAGLGIVAFYLSTFGKLAARLRGYAAAATVLALVALAANFLPLASIANETQPAPTPHRATHGAD